MSLQCKKHMTKNEADIKSDNFYYRKVGIVIIKEKQK